MTAVTYPDIVNGIFPDMLPFPAELQQKIFQMPVEYSWRSF
jgi:hypothetical protein